MMKLRLPLFLGVWVALLFSGSVWANCPIGPHDDHLTLPQVMVNFGLFVGPADSVAVNGTNPNLTVSDADIKNAATQLLSAEDCVNDVLASPTGDLLPDAASELTGTARTSYIHDFLYFMGEFKDELDTYHSLLVQLLAQKPAQRNFQALYQESQNLEDLVDHIHRKLTL